MNRLNHAFNRPNPILNIYYTAGYPKLNDTIEIAKQLHLNGVDMIEIGMPFSDPLADGKVIQESSQVALNNGMTISLLFDQISEIRSTVTDLPIILMGYLNQLLQFGVEPFLKKSKASGVDALIIPDLPLDVYLDEYQALFDAYNIKICFLVTPQTSKERILEISNVCTGFLYMVSTYSTTGNQFTLNENLRTYFKTIQELNLPIPRLIGFGIHNQDSFNTASEFAHGAIIGSAFIKALNTTYSLPENINHFIQSIR